MKVERERKITYKYHEKEFLKQLGIKGELIDVVMHITGQIDVVVNEE